jgi:hypothetical protein
MNVMSNYRVVMKDPDGKTLCTLCSHDDNDEAVRHLQEHGAQLRVYGFQGKLEIEH